MKIDIKTWSFKEKYLLFNFTLYGKLIFNNKNQCCRTPPDPGSVAFLTPGSGKGKKSGSGSGIRDEQPGSYFREHKTQYFGLTYLNSLIRIRDVKIWIRDGKIQIRDLG
jgi:hypothetical protein